MCWWIGEQWKGGVVTHRMYVFVYCVYFCWRVVCLGSHGVPSARSNLSTSTRRRRRAGLQNPLSSCGGPNGWSWCDNNEKIYNVHTWKKRCARVMG